MLLKQLKLVQVTFGLVSLCRSRVNNLFRVLPISCCFGTTSSKRSTIIRTMATTKKPFERLPTNVAPKNYALTLQPNLTEFTFTGKEVIDVEVMQKIIQNT